MKINFRLGCNDIILALTPLRCYFVVCYSTTKQLFAKICVWDC